MKFTINLPDDWSLDLIKAAANAGYDSKTAFVRAWMEQQVKAQRTANASNTALPPMPSNTDDTASTAMPHSDPQSRNGALSALVSPSAWNIGLGQAARPVNGASTPQDVLRQRKAEAVAKLANPVHSFDPDEEQA